MKIVFFHNQPLPVNGYGGTERILFWHMRELIKKGHNVVLVGHPDSKVSEYGIELIPIINEIKAWPGQVPKGADIIHLPFNETIDGDVPTLNTVHGNGKVGELLTANSVFVSKKHAEIHGSDQFVHNAVDFTEYPFQPKSKKDWNNFLFLAKASWKVKNLCHTVKACRQKNRHLQVAGGRWWGLSRYIHSHGIIGGAKKLELIRASDALLFPVRWHEPFGIAVIEAMSQGKPVVGSPYGSLPELINSDSGFIAKNYNDLERLLSEDHSFTFNAEKIRQYAEKNFGIEKYTANYLNLYKKVIGGEKLNSTPPTYQFKTRAEDLLPF